MTDRASMDRPATVTAALLGVLLIAASLPFLLDDDEGGRRYLISWDEQQVAARDQAFAGNGQVQEVELTASGLLSNVTVTLQCSDTRPAPQVQPAATITWTLYEDNETIADGTTQCAPGDVERVNRTDQPDIGSTRGASPADVQEKLSVDNETRTYRLEFRYDRAAGQVPNLPVGAATFAGRMGLEVDGWHAAVNEPEEVTR